MDLGLAAQVVYAESAAATGLFPPLRNSNWASSSRLGQLGAALLFVSALAELEAGSFQRGGSSTGQVDGRQLLEGGLGQTGSPGTDGLPYLAHKRSSARLFNALGNHIDYSIALHNPEDALGRSPDAPGLCQCRSVPWPISSLIVSG